MPIAPPSRFKTPTPLPSLPAASAVVPVERHWGYLRGVIRYETRPNAEWQADNLLTRKEVHATRGSFMEAVSAANQLAVARSNDGRMFLERGLYAITQPRDGAYLIELVNVQVPRGMKQPRFGGSDYPTDIAPAGNIPLLALVGTKQWIDFRSEAPANT